MARERRSIAGSAFESDKLDETSDSEMLLFFGLIVKADDSGRERATPAKLKKKFANRGWSSKKLITMMQKLHELQLIDWYFCKCGTFYEVTDFEYYQRGAWQGKSKVDSKYEPLSAGHCKQCGSPLETVEGCTKHRANGSEVNRNEDEVKRASEASTDCGKPSPKGEGAGETDYTYPFRQIAERHSK